MLETDNDALTVCAFYGNKALPGLKCHPEIGGHVFDINVRLGTEINHIHTIQIQCLPTSYFRGGVDRKLKVLCCLEIGVLTSPQC